jgi:lipopolysaccharide export system protein LptA
MHRIYPYLKIALLFSAFFLNKHPHWAQTGTLELLPGSELLGYDVKTGAHRLIGTVNFIYQGNTMYCDSAHYYEKKKAVKAYGSVQIKKDDVNLYCDSLYYDGKNKKAKLWGHVRARDLEYKITTDSLDYDAKKGRGTYRNKGKIESITSNESITSQFGYFYPESKDFFFKGNVKYRNEDLSMTTDTLQFTYSKQISTFFGPTTIKKGKTVMFCEKGWYNVKTEEGSLIKNAYLVDESKTIKGDTLLYQPKKGLSIAKGNVFFEDTIEKSKFYGNYGKISDFEHYTLLTGNSRIIKIRNADTIYIAADTIFNQNDTLNKPLFYNAYHEVKVFNNSMQAVSDSLHFADSIQKMELFGNPIIWSKNTELKADTMYVFLADTVIKNVHMRRNAFAVMELDSGEFYNQIKGNIMDALFEDGEIYETIVDGNAQTIFYPEEIIKTDTTITIKRLGMNSLISNDIKIYLDSGEVTKLIYNTEPEGIFYPMEEINSEVQFLDGFSWNQALRPRKPYFPIP